MATRLARRATCGDPNSLCASDGVSLVPRLAHTRRAPCQWESSVGSPDTRMPCGLRMAEYDARQRAHKDRPTLTVVE